MCFIMASKVCYSLIVLVCFGIITTPSTRPNVSVLLIQEEPEMPFHLYKQDDDKRPAAQMLELPIVETPLTRVTETWLTLQKGPCAAYELDYARCAARVGIHKADRDCKKFLEDVQECAYKKKALQRYAAIKAERNKQGRAPLEKPPPDSITTWFE